MMHSTADASRSVPPPPPEEPPISLESPMDAVVFAPTSAVAKASSETKRSAFEQLASEAVRRAGIRFDTLIVHADRVIVQANTVVIPVTTHDRVITTKDQRGVEVPRKTPLLLGSRHLIVKHVDLNATSVPFRDETHRDRTRRSFACECAMYRERSRAPGARGGDYGSWATPFVYLVEGDAEADAFTVVMDDAARPRPGALQKRREEEALEKLKKTLADAAEANDDSNPLPVVSVGALTGAVTSSIANQTTSVMLHENEAALAKKEDKDKDGSGYIGPGAGADGSNASNAPADSVAGPGPPVVGTAATAAKLPGTCDFYRARAAVQWLASFHAHWWRGLPDSPPIPDDLWPRGGYWTLEKRDFDLPSMDATWRGLLNAFDSDDADDAATRAASKALASELRSKCGEDFGERLRRAGPALSRAALRAEWGTPNCENGGATLVHGDFKAANIVFRRVARPKRSPEDADDDQGDEPPETDAPTAPTVIDWQWTGPGGAAHDLAYFLTTSLSPDALKRVDDLIDAYLTRLSNDLRSRGDAGRAAAAEYDDARLRRDLAVHFADYARYLAGDVWKTVTPESMRRYHAKTNMGAHRRCAEHLLFCATRGVAGLEMCENGEPGDAKDVDPDAPPPRADADVPPLRRGPVSRLVAEILGVCVALADDAGDIVRGVAESGHMGAVKDKSETGKDEREKNETGDSTKKRVKTSNKKKTGHTGDSGDRSTATATGSQTPVALDPQTQADRRSERLICDTLRRAFGKVVSVFGEEASEGALAKRGTANADGSVDDDDLSLLMSDARLAHVADFVRDWELLLPPELEVGPAAEARLVEAARRREEEKAAPPGKDGDEKENKTLFSHPACAESDVTVWVDPLDGTREFVEGPEFWSGVTVLIGVAVKGVPVAGVIHQPFVGTDGKPAASVLAAVAARAERKAALAAEGWKPKRKTKNPEDDLETFPKGSFGRGRTLWGVPGLGVLSHPGREPHKASPVMKPPRADVKNLRVATTRSHPSPFVEGAVYKLYPFSVIRTGGAGGKVALMLDGVVDTWVFPAKGTKRWDTCAGEALLFANRGGFVVRGSDGAAYEYGAAIAEWPGNVDGVIAGADKDLYPWMVHKWPWLNYAGGFRVGPRDAGLE